MQFGLSVRSTNQKHNRLEASRAAGANMVMHWLKSNWQNRLFGVADMIDNQQESEYETMRQLECEICSEPGEMKSAYYQNLWICWDCEAEAYADAKKTSSKRLALINKQRG